MKNTNGHNKTKIKQTINLLETKKASLEAIDTNYYGNEAAKIIQNAIDELNKLLNSGI